MALVLASGVTPVERPDDTPEKLEALYSAKAVAEIATADRLAPGSDIVRPSGAIVAEVALVKGLAGPAEGSGGAALSGADGAALAKALTALGHTADAAFRTLSRSDPTLSAEARAARLRGQLEAVDAALVIALDAEAAEDVAAAFGIPVPPFGVPVTAHGRRIVAVDGFEESLGDESHKKRVWAQMQAAAPLPPVF